MVDSRHIMCEGHPVLAYGSRRVRVRVRMLGAWLMLV